MKRQKTYLNESSKLYLVATPIGNLEDITLRALNTLKMVDIIYCEDTRVSIRLLQHFDIKTKLKSYHLFNENQISTSIIEQVKTGINVAIISDAGSPSISDPGWVAVKEAISQDIDVVVVPGASAVITALVGSGMTTQDFYFAGFLNSKSSKKEKELQSILKRKETVVLYEAPHRISDTLSLIDKLAPNRNIVLARELTKKYEEYLRGTANEIIPLVDELKGEMVLLIEGDKESSTNETLMALTIEEHYKHYLELGLDDKEALKQVAIDRNLSKKDIYQVIKK